MEATYNPYCYSPSYIDREYLSRGSAKVIVEAWLVCDQDRRRRRWKESRLV